MWDLLVILSLVVINTRSCNATNNPTSPPQLLPTDIEDAPDEDDEGMRMLASEDDDERYSGVGVLGNDDRNIPWDEVYSNLRVEGKRDPPQVMSDPIYPWEAAYSLRGKKVRVRMKKDFLYPWDTSYSIRGKKVRVRMKRDPGSLYPWEAVYSLRGKKTVANLPWQMSLQSPMLRGKKPAPQMPWQMNLHSPMLRGKKTKTLVNLPWQMDLKSPMLRGKKSSSSQIPVEMTIENPIIGAENTSADLVEEMMRAKKNNLKTEANLPWAFDYLSPMMRG